jgi:ABC-type transport system substrate-binding protein
MDMNNKIFPTNITLVRQAIVHAINYSAIIDVALAGQATTFTGPQAPFYNSTGTYNPAHLPPYQYNVTLAKQELAQAGFPNGQGLPVMQFYVDQAGITWQEPAAEIIQQNLADVGIQINLNVIANVAFFTPFGSYQTNLQNKDSIWQLAFDDPTAWAPDYMAPTDYWTSFVTTFSVYGNYAIYNNTAVDNDVAYMFTHTDQAGIISRLIDAQQRVYNDAPVAWLFATHLPIVDGSYVYKKSVIGGFFLEPNMNGNSDIPILNTIYPAASG